MSKPSFATSHLLHDNSNMNHQASPDDFELDKEYVPLRGRTLEEVIASGESEEEKGNPLERISANSMPQWLASVLLNLKRKHPNVPSVASVERLTAKLGVAVVRDRFEPAIAEIQALRTRVYQLGDQLLLKRVYRSGGYELSETVGTVYRKCSLREWTVGAISDGLVDPLGVPHSTAALIALIAGVSRSQTWVPRAWTQLAARELDHFGRYLTGEAARISTEILGNG